MDSLSESPSQQSPEYTPPAFPRWIDRAGMWGIGLSAFVFSLFLPLSSAMASLVRHSYSPWLLVVLALLTISFRFSHWRGRTLALSLTLVLFALPLTALWRTGFGEMHGLGGLLTFSDTARYLYEANRLLAGFPMTGFGARHPFAPGLLAVFLWFTNGNLQWTLAVWVLLNAIAVYLAARAVRESHGAFPAAVFVLLAFLFYRRFIGLTDTENLGFLLGMLAFTCLWESAIHKNPRWALMGLFFSAIALNARPGAMLLLPVLGIWLLTTFAAKKHWLTQKIFWQTLGVVLMAFFLNSLLAGIVNPRGQLFTNYGFTLYGIADGGSGWEQFFIDHPEVRQVDETEAARLSYRYAMEKLRDNPLPALHSIGASLLDFFSLKDQSAFGFVSDGELTAFNRSLPEHILPHRVTRLALWGLSLLGLPWLWRERRQPTATVLLWAGLGFVLSIPFAPPRDAAIMRVYAASMPFLFLLPLTGFLFLRKKAAACGPTEPERTHLNTPAIPMGMVLVILMIAGPILLRVLQQPLPPAQSGCPADAVSATIRIPPGAYLLVKSDSELERSYLPSIRHSDFLSSLQQFPYGDHFQELNTLEPPVMLMNSIDLNNGQMFWVVIPPTVMPSLSSQQAGIPLAVCGQWLPGIQANGFGFLMIDSIASWH